MADPGDIEVPPALPEGVDINDDEAILASLPVLDMAEFEREEAAFRLDEIAKAKFITLVEGRCPRCEAVVEAHNIGPDGVGQARIDHQEPCIAGQAGNEEADELFTKYGFEHGIIYAVINRGGKRVMVMSWARIEYRQGEQVR